MINLSDIRHIIVRAGTITADDIFSVAYINLFKRYMHQNEVSVIRTFKVRPEQTLENGYLVLGVGRGQFDYHNIELNRTCRANGVPYASLGLVVKECHEGYLNDVEFELFDQKFVSSLDDHERRKKKNHLAYCFGCFNRNWDNPNVNMNVNFNEAVSTAIPLLSRYIDGIRSLAKAKQIIDTALIENATLYLDTYAPIREFCALDDRIQFLGSPVRGNEYQIISIRKNDANKTKRTFPEKYHGLRLERGTYNDVGMNFCHNVGFKAIFKDKESAMKFMATIDN